MNRFKFEGCIECQHVGGGVLTDDCRRCMAGENFEERVKDTVEEMMLRETEREDDHG